MTENKLIDSQSSLTLELIKAIHPEANCPTFIYHLSFDYFPVLYSHCHQAFPQTQINQDSRCDIEHHLTRYWTK